MLSKLKSLSPNLSALLEIGILFLPSIPAYLWIWPNVKGIHWWVTQSLVYLYVLGGTLWIGLRRWNWAQLGIKRQGLGLGLACGVALVVGRTLVILSIDWELPLPPFSLARILWEVVFYFGFVAFTEELLFRGLVYHLLDEWKGYRWAIWGSAIGFGLWHVFGQGLLVGLAMVLYGMIFALARWRTGGILGLVLAHGLIDFLAAQMLPTMDVADLGRPGISCAICMLLGLTLIVITPIYFWKLHPILERKITGLTNKGAH